MGRKKNDEIPKSDFDVKESQDLLSFDSDADLGKCVAAFNFCANADNNLNTSSIDGGEEAILIKSSASEISDTEKVLPSFQNNTTSSNIKTAINISNTNKSKDLFDNRTIPIANGATPILDGETPDVKRTYTLRASTVRKVNELKSIHPDINACVSTIVDMALEHYYKYIIEEGGTQ
ncbi:hypothetical protein [Clostridium neonatale]|uniref:hypothetical protein n=1 Tax=Clostridium neonatale TaxID=137838 RepID=UPI00291BA318|nr:hypothetical protein [Clostridium neonatale]CAI3202368.1 conserved hypothetical protein [Clostridium neonatale]CAI3211161.1 conserved hypothetical protein [Clostridium neonatale]